jgi:hypothetical protein
VPRRKGPWRLENKSKRSSALMFHATFSVFIEGGHTKGLTKRKFAFLLKDC